MKHKALLIGVDQYEKTLYFRPLPFVTSDVAEMQSVLMSNCHFYVKATVAGKKATKENIYDAIKSFLSAAATPDALRLIYFSGHGFLSNSNCSARQSGAPRAECNQSKLQPVRWLVSEPAV